MTIAEDPFLGAVPLRNPPLKYIFFRGGSVKRTTSENVIFKDGCLCQLSIEINFKGQLTKSIVLKNSCNTNKFISFLNKFG
jgi:hypothetical protein